METSNHIQTAPRSPARLHPLLATAAVAVTLTSVVGAAALLGWLPNSRANPAATPANAVLAGQTVQAVPVVPVTPVAPVAQVAQAAPAPVQTRTVTVHRYVDTPRTVHSSYAPAHYQRPNTGVGAIGGAVVGGLLGNQVGHGRGRTLATVAGALGGGYVGNRLETAYHANY